MPSPGITTTECFLIACHSLPAARLAATKPQLTRRGNGGAAGATSVSRAARRAQAGPRAWRRSSPCRRANSSAPMTTHSNPPSDTARRSAAPTTAERGRGGRRPSPRTNSTPSAARPDAGAAAEAPQIDDLALELAVERGLLVGDADLAGQGVEEVEVAARQASRARIDDLDHADVARPRAQRRTEQRARVHRGFAIDGVVEARIGAVSATSARLVVRQHPTGDAAIGGKANLAPAAAALTVPRFALARDREAELAPRRGRAAAARSPRRRTARACGGWRNARDRPGR